MLIGAFSGLVTLLQLVVVILAISTIAVVASM